MKRRSLFGIAMAGFVLLLAGCAMTGPMAGRMSQMGIPWSRVSVRFSPAQLVVSAPYLGGAGMGSPSWGHCTHPWFAQLTSNHIFLTYAVAGDADDGKNGVAVADWPGWTTDGGLTWAVGKNPFIWVDGPPKHTVQAKAGESIVWHSGFRQNRVRTAAGVVLLYEMNLHYADQVGGISVFENRVVWSSDGVTMHGPETAQYYAPLRMLAAWPNSRGVLLPDGEILVTVFGLIAEEKRGNANFSLVLYKSADGGRSFVYQSTIANPEMVPWGTEGANEADMVLLPNGDLLCVARTSGASQQVDVGGMLLARSRDKGKTWERKNIGFAGADPHLQLLQNGVLALTYGRPDLYLAFSEDGGHTWRKKIKLNRNGELTTGYVDMVEVAPNRLLLTYDLWNVGHQGKKVVAIFTQLVDVDYDAPKTAVTAEGTQP